MHFDPSLFGKTLAVLRVLRGWTQKQLAAACQLKSSTISELEHSPDALTLAQLQRFSAAMDQPSFLLNVVLWLVRLHRRLMSSAAGGEAPAPGLATEAERIGEILDRFHQGGEGVQLTALAELKTELREREGRRLAAELWEVLEPLGPDERRLLTKAKLFQKPALVELLCQKSIDLAAHDADLAVAVAELALELAGRVPGEEKARWRLQGYAGFHYGNALKMKSTLAGAQAFLRAEALWDKGQPDKPGWLDEARVMGLKAALLHDQRKFAEALELINQALLLPSENERPYLLSSRARTLVELGDLPAAIVAFDQAANLLTTKGHLRLLRVVHFNRLYVLCEMGSYSEARRLLPSLYSVIPADKALDNVRVNWLEGKIALGLGHHQEALHLLSRVRDVFHARQLVYDEALVTLELAVIHLQSGSWTAVGQLAEALVPIFQTNGIHREALAALRLFHRAVLAKSLSPSLNRQLLQFFERARFNPSLRLEDFLSPESIGAGT